MKLTEQELDRQCSLNIRSYAKTVLKIQSLLERDPDARQDLNIPLNIHRYDELIRDGAIKDEDGKARDVICQAEDIFMHLGFIIHPGPYGNERRK